MSFDSDHVPNDTAKSETSARPRVRRTWFGGVFCHPIDTDKTDFTCQAGATHRALLKIELLQIHNRLQT